MKTGGSNYHPYLGEEVSTLAMMETVVVNSDSLKSGYADVSACTFEEQKQE